MADELRRITAQARSLTSSQRFGGLFQFMYREATMGKYKYRFHRKLSAEVRVELEDHGFDVSEVHHHPHSCVCPGDYYREDCNCRIDYDTTTISWASPSPCEKDLCSVLHKLSCEFEYKNLLNCLDKLATSGCDSYSLGKCPDTSLLSYLQEKGFTIIRERRQAVPCKCESECSCNSRPAYDDITITWK